MAPTNNPTTSTQASDKAIQQPNASQDAEQGTVSLASTAQDDATASNTPTTNHLSELRNNWPPGSGPPDFCFPTPEEHVPSILDFVMLAASRGRKPSDRTGGGRKQTGRSNNENLSIRLRRDWDDHNSYWTIDHPHDGRWIVVYIEAKGTKPAHWRRVCGSGYPADYPNAPVAYPLDTKCLEQTWLSRVLARALANVSSNDAATQAGMTSSTDPDATRWESEHKKKRLFNGNLKSIPKKTTTKYRLCEGDAESSASNAPGYQKGKGEKQVEVIQID
ncbi:hypothetical protein XPA_005047 [Xanthoria parietina]